MSTQKPTANLDWSLHVDCPKCDESNNLASQKHDAENSIANHIFKNEWDKLECWEVTCEHCGHEFEIEKVEY
jgi:phage FluMu protein Com